MMNGHSDGDDFTLFSFPILLIKQYVLKNFLFVEYLMAQEIIELLFS